MLRGREFTHTFSGQDLVFLRSALGSRAMFKTFGHQMNNSTPTKVIIVVQASSMCYQHRQRVPLLNSFIILIILIYLERISVQPMPLWPSGLEMALAIL